MSVPVNQSRLHSASHDDLVVPRSRMTRYGRRLFAVFGSSLWNSFPPTTRDPTLTQFCVLVKTLGDCKDLLREPKSTYLLTLNVFSNWQLVRSRYFDRFRSDVVADWPKCIFLLLEMWCLCSACSVSWCYSYCALFTWAALCQTQILFSQPFYAW